MKFSAFALQQLKYEAEALLRQPVDHAFDSAITLMNSARRIVTCGMGKSAFMAGRLASSLCSIGLDAQFIHAAEGAHGEIGLLRPMDVVVIFSYSGKSVELTPVIDRCIALGVSIVAICGNADSPLAIASRTVISLPNDVENFRIKEIPSASLTLMTSISNAIVAALAEARHLSEEQYKLYHPGGKIGAALQTIEQLMHTGDQFPAVHRETKMSEGLVTMSAKRLGCLVVVDDDGLVVGIISDGDLRRHMSPDLLQRRADEIMTVSPVCVDASIRISRAVEMMHQKKITSLIVVDGKKAVGLLHIHDCLSYL